MRQRKYIKDQGRDSFVRNYAENDFKENASKATQMVIGEIVFPQPEPLYPQTMVVVETARGERFTEVAYPNAAFDPITGNLQGLYEGPFPGQMVAVGFENGNNGAPFVVNRYPYQGVANSLTEVKFINPLAQNLFHPFDVILGHFSGSYMSFNTGIFPSVKLPGSITIDALTDFEVSTNTQFSISSILGAEVSGSVLLSLNSATQSMKTLIDNLFDILDGFSTAGSPVAHTTDAATKALLAVEKAKWALLLL